MYHVPVEPAHRFGSGRTGATLEAPTATRTVKGVFAAVAIPLVAVAGVSFPSAAGTVALGLAVGAAGRRLRGLRRGDARSTDAGDRPVPAAD